VTEAESSDLFRAADRERRYLWKRGLGTPLGRKAPLLITGEDVGALTGEAAKVSLP